MYEIVEEQTFTSEEFIFKENEYEKLDFYYIIKGSVLVLQNVGKRDMPMTNVYTIKAGNTFGEIEFFSGLPRNSGI